MFDECKMLLFKIVKQDCDAHKDVFANVVMQDYNV
jgi:hypothetical protein